MTILRTKGLNDWILIIRQYDKYVVCNCISVTSFGKMISYLSISRCYKFLLILKRSALINFLLKLVKKFSWFKIQYTLYAQYRLFNQYQNINKLVKVKSISIFDRFYGASLILYAKVLQNSIYKVSFPFSQCKFKYRMITVLFSLHISSKNSSDFHDFTNRLSK